MADYSQTVTNRVGVWGLAAPSLWGAYNWGAFKWGEGTEVIPKTVVHLVENTLTPTEAFAGAAVVHLITESFSPTFDYIGNQVISLISESLSVDADMESETLTDGAGYLHVFTDRTTEAEGRQTASWSSGSTSSATWSSQAAGSTTWSES